MKSVSVIGIGKLGAPMAVGFAARGFRVKAVDLSPQKVDAINRGVPPVPEPGLAELIKEAGSQLTATQNIGEAVEDTETTFIVVGTPSDDSGGFSLEYVLPTCEAIGRALATKKSFHLVVLTSTVMPGSTGGAVAAALERASGKRCGKDFGLCYNPEFIALGTVIRDFYNPDFLLIGESDPRSGELLSGIYKEICKNSPPIARMNFINAEITKLAVNTYITTKISYANMLARLCEKLPEADVNVVTDALGLDTRIGAKYLKGAVSYGGPCVLPDTLIQTVNGLERIDTLEIGDRVLTHDGQYHAITAVHRRYYDGELLKIMSEGFSGDPVVTTPEHPIWTASPLFIGKQRLPSVKEYGNKGTIRLGYMTDAGPLDFKPSKDIARGDLLALPRIKPPNCCQAFMNLSNDRGIGRPSPTIGCHQLDEEMLYTLGWYLAEGWTWQKEIYLSLHRKAEYRAAEISEIWSRRLGIVTNIKRRLRSGIRTRTISGPFARFLRSTFGSYCYDKRVPMEWLGLPENQLRALLGGIWYGGGSNSDEQFSWATTSRDLFNFVKLAFLRLGIAFTTKKAKECTGRDGVKHRRALFVCVRNPIEFPKMKELLLDLSMEPKTSGKRTTWWRDDAMLCHVKNISRVAYSGEVFNLEVENAESYVLEGATVHNCFPRDNRALAALASRVGASSGLAEATDIFNRAQIKSVAEIVKGHHSGSQPIGILGLTYKPNTDVVEESFGLLLAQELSSAYFSIIVYDPSGDATRALSVHKNIRVSPSAEECISESGVVVLATPWQEFREIPAARWTSRTKPRVVIDCWRALGHLEGVQGLHYVKLGFGFSRRGSKTGATKKPVTASSTAN